MKSTQLTPSVQRLRITEDEAGQRIDNFLLRICKGVPKSHIYQVLRSGQVRVNSGRVAQTYKLVEGDEVRVPPIRTAQASAEHSPTMMATAAAASVHKFNVVFEDAVLLVIDKPAGLAVHGGSGVSFGVIELLRQQRPESKFLELAHRLDRETSGLLILGKKRSALNALQDQMREGKIEKRYLTMVSGRWLNALQHIKLPLYKYLTGDGERRVTVNAEGKFAHSIVRLVKSGNPYSLVEVELKTGRTHQIRVHLQSLGFPLLGDDKYGDFALNKILMKQGLSRMFLHAAVLRLTHPVTNERMELNAPLPDALAGFVEKIFGKNDKTPTKT